MPAPSSKKSEERKVVVDSWGSMYMLSKKDLSSDEMETLRRSRNPTTVGTANEEVQTNEGAQVYVHDLDLFVTVQILDDTPAVLSLGKLCEEHGYTCVWASGQKPHVTKQGQIFYAQVRADTLLDGKPATTVHVWHQPLAQPRKPRAKELALWRSHHLAWMGAPHGWVPVDTHSTPVRTSVRRLWVAQTTSTSRAQTSNPTGG